MPRCSFLEFGPFIVSTTAVESIRKRSNQFLSDSKSYSLTRFFGNLKVRPKLMVLHNLFFLVLTCAAYFSLIPLFEKLVADARAREVSILHKFRALRARSSCRSNLTRTRLRALV